MTDDNAARPVTTQLVGEGDDAITYDILGDLATATPERPVLFLFGAPMDATGFGLLAGHFTDRPVVTYDPRGTGRNPLGTADITVDRHADDLHRVISALGVGAVDAFGTSGGGVNLLALVAAHPEDVRYAVAHEPATAALAGRARGARRGRRPEAHVRRARRRPGHGEVHPIRDAGRNRSGRLPPAA
ncbi:alpha/beta fold hydrolase [Microbacterium elymi]|uniref:Alpha/beta hydrolase n=1 Tax=Microbacterium elymi TaxID=2909587 RepID=A0ABY5NGT1_9MICO|nr:alpha/beta hydrolase [Microbacterium elymi]UUT34399.1 alpha/beta hydrolase [Microbacterium elymi]